MRPRSSGSTSAPGSAISDPVVHFCADGTAQVSFGYKAGPVTLKGVGEGTITPVAAGRRRDGDPGRRAPVGGERRSSAPSRASRRMRRRWAWRGPVKTVTVTKGQVVVAQ